MQDFWPLDAHPLLKNDPPSLEKGFFKKTPYVSEFIPISRIDFDNKDFNLRFFQSPPESLISSIKKYGIILPPLVRQQGEAYQILDGFRRIEVALNLGLKSILCNLHLPDSSEEEIIFFLLSLFLSGHLPHILDQAVILIRFSKMLDTEKIINDILPLLGQPPSKKVLNRLIPLAGLGEKLGRALLENSINQDMALLLMELSPAEREMIRTLFFYYNFSQSKQFEILENLMDISKREKKTPTQVLAGLGWTGEPAFNGSASKPSNNKNKDKDKVKTGEEFRVRLKAKRYPILNKLEENWKQQCQKLHIPPTLSLSHPPFFEGGVYRMGFAFRDLKGFQERITELQALNTEDEWKRLFST